MLRVALAQMPSTTLWQRTAATLRVDVRALPPRQACAEPAAAVVAGWVRALPATG
ncbi:hypothetical protein LMF57_14885 [Stenotrophomonas sp. SI-NJAU-1]|uniref:hypothetical protein n=1 Tax=unclassified Stenotrophomonas TaxID=196198 RepID=UPI0013C34543|nr:MULTISPECIES: hypothetical protein [unclassified Stenotrophomonas]UEX17278.1 hypothetical protein LMF57_14885 [Stenotrophomonas sp. SI-NJAU-1]